jgi:hypothetical protein
MAPIFLLAATALEHLRQVPDALMVVAETPKAWDAKAPAAA